MTAKIALDAATDQALAVAADERNSVNPMVLLLVERGDACADMLADQFPGDEELAGRVLASAASMLARAAEDGLPNTESVPVTLSFAAESLYRKGSAP
jgi:hypothetical protein